MCIGTTFYHYQEYVAIATTDVKELMRELSNKDPEFRRDAIEKLAEIGPFAKETIPKLLDVALHDDHLESVRNPDYDYYEDDPENEYIMDYVLRKKAFYTLGYIGEVTIPDLIKLLDISDTDIAKSAANAINIALNFAKDVSILIERIGFNIMTGWEHGRGR